LKKSQFLVEYVGVNAVAFQHLEEFVIFEPVTAVAITTDAETNTQARIVIIVMIIIN